MKFNIAKLLYNSDAARYLAIVLFAGFAFYLLISVAAAYFVIEVPMSDDWCLKTHGDFVVDYAKEGSPCVEFKNKWEEIKYNHNLSMKHRNMYLYFYSVLIATVGSLLALKWLWKMDLWVWRSRFLAGQAGLLIGVLMPLVFSWILPPPMEWFPDMIVRMHESKVDETLKILENLVPGTHG